MLGSLDTQLLLGLTFLAFQTQNHLTRGLGLFVKDGLGLSTKAHLLAIVTALSLCKVGSLTCFVLGHLVGGVLLALAGAVSLAFFRDVYHRSKTLLKCQSKGLQEMEKNVRRETNRSTKNLQPNVHFSLNEPAFVATQQINASILTKDAKLIQRKTPRSGNGREFQPVPPTFPWNRCQDNVEDLINCRF
jgi:hypothetical protein